MSNITFDEDPSSRKVTRILLVSQIAGIGIVLGFRFVHLYTLAFVVSSLLLGFLLFCLLWLYARYRLLSVVREKRELNHLLLKFQIGVDKEGSLIQSAVREQKALAQAEKEEAGLLLSRLQKNHMEHGLAASPIREANIPGLDPTLRDRLAGYGILTAADVTDRIATLPGLDDAQRQALLIWGQSVLQRLENTQPKRLGDSQLDNIEENYRALNASNDALHRKAYASKQLLEHEIISFKARLRELAPLSFPRYVGHSLDSRRPVAALIAVLLIAAQVSSTVIAARAPAMDSLPAETLAPQATILPIQPVSHSTIPAPIPSSPATSVPLSPSPLPPSSTASPLPTLTPAPSATVLAELPPGIAACVPQNTSRETGLVVGVVDGDTIDVRLSDRDVRVRYIGVDTPGQDQAYFAEAAAYNRKLVENKTVTLVKDTSETDRFNRLLRYVIVGDTFVNHELVALGYAQAAAYPPDTACLSTFETTQRKAQLVKVGLWVPTPELHIPAITGAEATPTCDPSYPGVCIPPAPPDLDCGQIQYRRFQVLPPDPHGFDRDGDGVGCES